LPTSLSSSASSLAVCTSWEVCRKIHTCLSGFHDLCLVLVAHPVVCWCWIQFNHGLHQKTHATIVIGLCTHMIYAGPTTNGACSRAEPMCA
jgi:hypothetical protein